MPLPFSWAAQPSSVRFELSTALSNYVPPSIHRKGGVTKLGVSKVRRHVLTERVHAEVGKMLASTFLALLHGYRY